MAPRARLVVLLFVGTAGLAALRASGDEPSPFVQMALVITGARGQSVRSLTPADLEVTEDGQKRKVASVALRGPAPRTIAVLLDEYHVSPGESSVRAREATLAFVDRQVQGNDVLFVMKPLDPHSAIASTSAATARARIREFSGRKGDFTPATPFESEYMSASAPTAPRQRAQVVRAALEALTMAMREPIDAPKALVLVSEGFPADERSRARTSTMLAIARTAALSNIPLYVVDPGATVEPASPFNDRWRALVEQTGGTLFTAGSDPNQAYARIAADLGAQFVVRFESAGKQDGGFHGVQVRLTRPGATLRAASGYWAPFAPLRVMTPRIDYASLLTPHLSGLIQPWFRMSPGASGQTRVTFLWTPRRPDGRASMVEFAAITFEGKRLHEAAVAASSVTPAGSTMTSFEAPPGPLQISMAVANASGRVLGTDVRYIDVPKLNATKPVIAAVEFVRPRSLPEFTALKADSGAVPTDVRDFHRQDRLLIRVRAFAGSGRADVRVRFLNRPGQVLFELVRVDGVDDAAQFELSFARYPRGEYLLEIRASSVGESISQIVPVRVIG